ncbi:uncharacterized protein LOC121367300 [Gigantopelta aegis]|uniref:uncharacterized protein LOC121367300 n=1 Tax=Gigantopelta aegis TaxID=1735272 RepID=UPI001B88AF25|nr:uncharacterized protein LOC121367300 [Gigantopelta aegis]
MHRSSHRRRQPSDYVNRDASPFLNQELLQLLSVERGLLSPSNLAIKIAINDDKFGGLIATDASPHHYTTTSERFDFINATTGCTFSSASIHSHSPIPTEKAEPTLIGDGLVEHPGSEGLNRAAAKLNQSSETSTLWWSSLYSCDMLCRIVLTVLLSSLTLFKTTTPSGVFEIGFLSYTLEYGNRQTTTEEPAARDVDAKGNVTSPSGHNVTGNATEPYKPWQTPARCSAPSRYRFHVCMESVSSNKTCDLGHEDIPLTQIDTSQGSVFVTGRDRVQFNNRPLRTSPTRLPNPIQYRFQSWMGSLVLNVYVECCGTPDDIQKRCKEKLSLNVTATPFTGVTSPRYSRITISGKATLVLMLSLYCLPNFYGPKCERFCQVSNPNENKICHPQTGELICRPGLKGERCSEDKNECDKGICQNGGDCVNYPGTFRCFCRSQVTTGRFCEFIIPSCPKNPCKNGGTCEETNPDYKCHCSSGWHGLTCEMKTADSATDRDTDQLKAADSLKLSVSEQAKSVSNDPNQDVEETQKEDFHIWYIGLGLVILTIVVTIILIVCVIWTGKRGQYKVPSAAPPTIVSISTQPGGSFDNDIYFCDPEILDLQPRIPPSSSTHYQRTLVHTDREYTNVRPLYEDRIQPDCVTESPGNSYGATRERKLSAHHLLESRRSSEATNVYVDWNNSVTSRETDNPYEEIDVKGLSSAGVPWSDCSALSGDVRGIEYRKTSDVTSGQFERDNAGEPETPNFQDKRKQSTTAISGGLADWPSETNRRKKKAGYNLKSAW